MLNTMNNRFPRGWRLASKSMDLSRFVFTRSDTRSHRFERFCRKLYVYGYWINLCFAYSEVVGKAIWKASESANRDGKPAGNRYGDRESMKASESANGDGETTGGRPGPAGELVPSLSSNPI
jgi:hypothetical protein